MTLLTDRYRTAVRLAIRWRWVTVGGGVAGFVLAIYLAVGG